jgi:hypothetical protein
MKNLIVSLLLFVVVAYGQSNLNYRGYGDTANITTFAANSLFVSKAFIMSNGEGNVLLFNVKDTTNADRVADSAGLYLDSVKCEIGIEYGSPFKNLSGKMDTVWTFGMTLDTCDLIDSAKAYNPLKMIGGTRWPLDSATGVSIRKRVQVDTTINDSSQCIAIPFVSPANRWFPYVRFFTKGLTGNKVGAFLRARFTYLQRAFTSVRQQ